MRGVGGASLASYCSCELLFVHLRAAFDALAARFFVKLLSGSAAGTSVRPQSAASAGRDVLNRCPASLLRFTRSGTLLIHGTGGDFFCLLAFDSPLAQAALDVLVLALSFGAPGFLRHG